MSVSVLMNCAVLDRSYFSYLFLASLLYNKNGIYIVRLQITLNSTLSCWSTCQLIQCSSFNEANLPAIFVLARFDGLRNNFQFCWEFVQQSILHPKFPKFNATEVCLFLLKNVALYSKSLAIEGEDMLIFKFSNVPFFFICFHIFLL